MKILRCLNIFIIFGFVVVFVLFGVAGCGGGSGSGENDNGDETTPPVVIGFTSFEEFESNPDVQDAIRESGIGFDDIRGEDISSLEGKYQSSGEVVDSTDPEILGPLTPSNILLSNQTVYDIDYEESVGEFGVNTIASYITGTDGLFTLWVDSGEIEIGGCRIWNAAIISGTRQGNGDLSAEVLTVNIYKENCEEYIVPQWYKADIYLAYEGSGSGQINAPTNLVAETVSETSISLSWQDNSDDESGFTLLVINGGEIYGSVVLDPDTTGYTVNGLGPDTEYTFMVKARGSYDSEWATLNVTTLPEGEPVFCQVMKYDTSLVNQTMMFYTISGETRVRFLATPDPNYSAPSGDIFDLGVNLPSTGYFPADAASADMSDLGGGLSAVVEFGPETSPSFEVGKYYYILIEKVGVGGPVQLEFCTW